MTWDEIDVHTLMLSDRVRTLAFREAIERTVKAGMTVLDFGCGSGVLSFFAERAGATRVYAIDSSPFIKAARAVAKRNGFTKIEFMQTDGGDFSLPTRVDVIVSECLGHYVFTDAMMPTLFRARDRYLAPNGTMLPSRVRLMAALVTAPPTSVFSDFYDEQQYGIDFTPLRPFARGHARKRRFEPNALARPFLRMDEIDFSVARLDPNLPRTTSAHARLDTAVTIYGIAGWFDADLGGVHLDTGPEAPPTCWDQTYFPLLDPRTVGGDVEVTICAIPSRGSARWRWSIRWPGGESNNDDLIQLHVTKAE